MAEHRRFADFSRAARRRVWILRGRGRLALLAPTLPACAQDAHSKLEAQYQSENDPVRKAKIVAKLGHFEIDQSRADLKAGDEEKALAVLERYNDEVRKTAEALTGFRN